MSPLSTAAGRQREARLHARDLALRGCGHDHPVRPRPADRGRQLQLGARRTRQRRERFVLPIERGDDDVSASAVAVRGDRNRTVARRHRSLTKAVTQEPKNGAYIDSLGWVYFRQGKLDLAEKYLLDATKLLPRDATVHEHLGDVLAKRGDVGRALEVYRAALKLDPEAKDEAKLRSKIAELEKQKTAAQR